MGELLIYRPQFESVTFAGPEMEAVFRTVNEMGGVVMIHPRDGFWGSVQRPEAPSELEEAIRTYPNVTFLFHGIPWALEKLLLPLMQEFPNVFYTFDVIQMMLVDHQRSGWDTIFDNLDREDPNTVEKFLTRVVQVGVDTIVESAIGDSAIWFQQKPDRILWGTDIYWWMWEKPVSDKFIEIGREFIGRLPEDLPEDLQEDYAHKNAQRVFGKYLIPAR